MRNFALYFSMPIIVFAFISCESSFEPLDKSKGYNFSMYGTLNVHADTQWVRVMPVGEVLIPNDSTPNGTMVTLTRVSTGETVIMNDSLFNYSGLALAWNYWTTDRIYPNEVYRLEASGIDGKTSFALVETPSELPLPIIEYSSTAFPGRLTGQTNSELVEATVKYTVQVGFSHIEVVKVSLLSLVKYEDDSSYSIFIPIGDNNIQSALNISPDDFGVIEKEFILAIGSEDWPDLSNFSEEEIYFPESVRNVENGVGFVAGVALLRMPLESCFDSMGDRTPCDPLDY